MLDIFPYYPFAYYSTCKYVLDKKYPVGIMLSWGKNLAVIANNTKKRRFLIWKNVYSALQA